MYRRVHISTAIAATLSNSIESRGAGLNISNECENELSIIDGSRERRNELLHNVFDVENLILEWWFSNVRWTDNTPRCYSAQMAILNTLYHIVVDVNMCRRNLHERSE